MSQARVLLRNILGDWSGFAVQVLVTFFMTPFVLHTLGDARYGVWLIMMGLTGYYGLLDVGFRSGLTQYLPRYLALRDFEKLNRTASTGFAALLVCGSVVLVACLVLSALAPKFFKVPEELIGDIRLGIVILGVSAAAQLAFAPFSAVFSATQRHDISGAIGIVTRLLQAGLILLVLSRGSGLVGLSIVCSSVSMLDYVVRWYVAHKILPELSISLRKANWGSLWEFTSFGLWNVAIHGSQRVVLYTSALILGWFFPPAAITSFGLAGSVNEYFFSMLRPIGFAFFPALVHLDARGDESLLRATYIAGTRMMAVISLAGAAIAVAWAAPFIGIWAGPEYLHMAPGVLSEPLFDRLAEEMTVRQKAKGIELAEILSYTATPVVFYLLVGSSVVRGMQRIGLQFLLATRRHKLCAAIFATEAVSNIVLSIILTRRYGLAGCAIGTLIPALVIQGLVQPYCVHRAMEIRLREYLVGVLVRPVLMALVVGLVVIGLRLAAPIGVWGDWLSVALARPEWVGTKTLGWADLFFRGGLSLSAAAAGAVFIGLRRDERQRFVYGPLADLSRKLSRKKRKSGVSEPAIATAVNESGDAGA